VWYSQILVENRRFNLPHLCLAPPSGVTPLEFRRDLWHQKTIRIALSCGIKISPVCSLDLSQKKHACDRRTDGRADRHNYDSQDRASIAASRGKNTLPVSSPCTLATHKSSLLKQTFLLSFLGCRLFNIRISRFSPVTDKHTQDWVCLFWHSCKSCLANMSMRHRPIVVSSPCNHPQCQRRSWLNACSDGKKVNCPLVAGTFSHHSRKLRQLRSCVI